MDWNEERIANLKKLWQAGLSASQVARQLGGVSRSAVIGKVHRMGIAVRQEPVRLHAVGVRTPSRHVRRPSLDTTRRSVTVRSERPIAAPRQAFEVEPTASLQSLSPHGCRWPIGDPDSPEFGFCGRLSAGRRSYCMGHLQMAFRRFNAAAANAELNRLASGLGAKTLRPANG